VAVIGVILLHLAGVFFLVEAHSQYKKRKKEKPTPPYGSYNMQHLLNSELKGNFGAEEKGGETSGPRKFLDSISGLLPKFSFSGMRERISGRGGNPPIQESQTNNPQTYQSARQHDTALGAGGERPSSGGSEIGEEMPPAGSRRPIPIQSYSSEDSFEEPPHKPFPRSSPPQMSTISHEQRTRKALENIMKSVEEVRPDSGLGRSPSPPDPPLSRSGLSNFVHSKKGRDKKGNKNKPNFDKIFGHTSTPPSARPLELDSPPRVRRPSGNSQRDRSFPEQEVGLSTDAPPPEPFCISIESFQKKPYSPPKQKPPPPPPLLIKKTKPTSLSIGTSAIPPPPLDSDDDDNMHSSQFHYPQRSLTSF
jgi:hypothetical protein